jgi:hypothetical protein
LRQVIKHTIHENYVNVPSSKLAYILWPEVGLPTFGAPISHFTHRMRACTARMCTRRALSRNCFANVTLLRMSRVANAQHHDIPGIPPNELRCPSHAFVACARHACILRNECTHRMCTGTTPVAKGILFVVPRIVPFGGDSDSIILSYAKCIALIVLCQNS